jgi:prepilin-type N-terminal cleavage/methylation domain-containing protein
MNLHFTYKSSSKHFHTRGGVTLTEVLMSLMIMSIGLSAVAVLFPISALRSAQATQLTNAAVLKQNIATVLAMNPRLVFDPDGDFRRTQNPAALNVHFAQGNRVYLVDPFGFYSIYGADNDGNGSIDAADDEFANWFGNTGNAPLTAVRRYDGGLFARLQYALPVPPILPRPPLSTTLTVDQKRAFPLLSSYVSQLGSSWEDQLDTFVPNGGLLPPAVDIDGNSIIVGAQLDSADDLRAIPDLSQITATDGAGNAIQTPNVYQVVVFSVDGRTSQALPLTKIDTGTNQIYWSEYTPAWTDINKNNMRDSNPLSREFLIDTDANNIPDTFAVGRIVLQSQRTNNFNWLLSVRRSGDGRAVIDVLIRHGNAVQLSDETVFPVQLVRPGTVLGVNVSGFVAGLRKSPTGEEPPLRRGGYFYEPNRGRWYRISSYEEKPISITTDNFWNAYDYRLTLQTEAKETQGQDSDLNGFNDANNTSAIPTNGELGGAIFMPGIVDVYPMGTFTLPDISELQ